MASVLALPTARMALALTCRLQARIGIPCDAFDLCIAGDAEAMLKHDWQGEDFGLCDELELDVCMRYLEVQERFAARLSSMNWLAWIGVVTSITALPFMSASCIELDPSSDRNVLKVPVARPSYT